MTATHFWKYHGLGNDFILFDAMRKKFDLDASKAVQLCDRRKGIGADGVIIAKPSEKPDCAGYMHYIGADGAENRTCVNGIRCFTKFLVDNEYVNVNSGHMIADTLGGPRSIEFDIGKERLMTCAAIDMGEPVFDPERIPALLDTSARTKNGTPYVREALLPSPWGALTFTCMNIGGPHAVCFLDAEALNAFPSECFTEAHESACEGERGPSAPAESAVDQIGVTAPSLNALDVEKLGAFFACHNVFPHNACVEFAVIRDRRNVDMRMYDSGRGELHASGIGACATQVASYLLGLTNAEANLHLTGGTLQVMIEDGHVIMAGTAAMSFKGIIDL